MSGESSLFLNLHHSIFACLILEVVVTVSFVQESDYLGDMVILISEWKIKAQFLKTSLSDLDFIYIKYF